MKNALQELQDWYYSQCDGDWEHEWRIRVETLDNPGWRLRINLEGTDIANRPFFRIDRLEPEADWVTCWVQDATFEAACGPLLFEEAISIFLSWAKGKRISQSEV